MRDLIRRVAHKARIYHFLQRIRYLLGSTAFLVLCGIGLSSSIIYTYITVERVKKNSAHMTKALSQLTVSVIKNTDYATLFPNELMKQISISGISFILADTSWNPLRWGNIQGVSEGLGGKDIVRLFETLESLREQNNFVTVKFRDEHEAYFLMGENPLTKKLSIALYVEIALIVVFSGIFYISISNKKNNERSNLWVCLAKEAAHQLGTPISALMGWVEYIKLVPPDEAELFLDQVKIICNDMEHDLERLRRITARFSQIGSIPALTPNDLNSILTEVSGYFKIRLPLLQRKLTIDLALGVIPPVPVNSDLIRWVFENLIKNSIDAIQVTGGQIEIATVYLPEAGVVRIIHRDNGSGMSRDTQNRIFSPGFTTKKRGWGLGLTLAKRVVNDYHKGNIYIEWSQKGRGTIFHIDLPVGA